MKIVAISAGLSEASSSTLLADQLADAVRAQNPAAQVDVIGLRGLAHEITDATLTGFGAPALQSVLDSVSEADGIIVVTPVFKASYPGLFKSFFDVLDADALVGKPVLLAATGGTARHSLVIDMAMRPLFAYLQALVVPTGVFASPHDWGDEGAVALSKRVDRATGELVSLLKGAGTGRGPETDIDLFSDAMLQIRQG